MEKKLSIKVNVADRFYPLKIDQRDEEKIRRAAKMINEKVLQYKQRYTDKDAQDFLAMAALQYVIKLIEQENVNDIFPVLSEVNEINTQLADYLEEE